MKHSRWGQSVASPPTTINLIKTITARTKQLAKIPRTVKETILN